MSRHAPTLAGREKGTQVAADESLMDVERVVYVFEASQSKPSVKTVITGLGYPVLDGAQFEARPGGFAAVIDLCMDPDLILAKQVSSICRVVLVAPEADFKLRLTATRAGIDAIVSSPVDPVELGSWLEDFDRSTEPALNILIVDDDSLAAEFYALALQQDGMTTHIVTDPSAALNKIAETSPDLVLLDMQMPGVNGLELARVIRQSRRHLSMPLIFLSAEKDAARQHGARSVGGDDFITKPIDPQRLAAVVRMRAGRAILLRKAMERDSLTGLMNHARYKERVAAELERSRRTGTTFCVAMIDIDHFKRINDTHGHQIGDRVIQSLSQTLVGGLRQVDVVARYGGEEFGILLVDTAAEAGRCVIERIRRSFADTPLMVGNTAYPLTFSAGIAASANALEAEDLLAAADAAMYAAKHAGRNNVAVAKTR